MTDAATSRRPSPQEDILRAAEDCFEKFGLAKTTMDDVARFAGVSRATVYRYFSDRESLILAAVRRRARQNIARVRSEIVRHGSFAERLEEGIVRDVRRGKRDPVVHALVAASEMTLATALLSGTGVGLELTRELWEPVLQAAQESGDLRPDVDVVELCAWISHLEILFISQFGDDDASVARMRELVRQFVVPAVVPR